MAAEDLRLECLRFCRVAHTLDGPALSRVEQLVEALKNLLSKKVANFLDKHRHTAVLECYSSDATPLLVSSTSSMSSTTLGSTRRTGRHKVEFLMQSAFYKAKNASGVMEMVMLVTDPKPLTAGKRGWNLFSAACDFLPLLRRRGHKGLCLQHMCADRAVFSSLDRHLRGRHAAFYDGRHGPDLGPEAPLLQNTDWMLSTPCGVHDAHNGLKWGLSLFTDATTLEDVHIVIESLRNTFEPLRAHIPHFLQSKLRIHDPAQPATAATRMVWALLGVEPDWLEMVVSLNPIWVGGWLFVNDTDEGQPSAVEQTSHLYFHLMKWTKFTESRWASIGSACRALAATLLLGLPELVTLTKADPLVSHYHIGGFDRMNGKIVEFLVIAAASSYPIENFILSLLHDDRLLAQLPDLEADLQEETRYLENLPMEVRQRLGALHPDPSASSPAKLRSTCSTHLPGLSA